MIWMLPTAGSSSEFRFHVYNLTQIPSQAGPIARLLEKVKPGHPWMDPSHHMSQYLHEYYAYLYLPFHPAYTADPANASAFLAIDLLRGKLGRSFSAAEMSASSNAAVFIHQIPPITQWIHCQPYYQKHSGVDHHQLSYYSTLWISV